MSDKYKVTWFYSSLAVNEGTAVFGLIKTQAASQTTINFDDYANRLAAIYNDFDSQGYDVLNVIPMNMGSADSFSAGEGMTGYAGYSITRGAVVVGKRRE
jgi:hypothetical protein